MEGQEERHALRWRILNTINDLTEGNTHALFFWRDIAGHLEVDPEIVGKALDYLESEGLVSQLAVGSYAISHRGIKKLEGSVDHHGFGQFIAAHNVAVVHGSGNTVVQASVGALELPGEVAQLKRDLDRIDGRETEETAAFVRALTSSNPSELQIAAAAENIERKSKGHSFVLEGFQKKLGETLGAASGVAVGQAAGWMATHGDQTIKALKLLFRQG